MRCLCNVGRCMDYDFLPSIRPQLLSLWPDADVFIGLFIIIYKRFSCARTFCDAALHLLLPHSSNPIQSIYSDCDKLDCGFAGTQDLLSLRLGLQKR
ncbi:hypothetical protein MRB53_022888 [Persea americana]|uniref:Uncharacterized protein n=1 Tax=Persea americana TaxID=3435 RepID=A0ACC2L7Z9_PERAE|nr:hypothetical protein MRB53_022888 [Persea americana]